jgi:ABC-type sugar transport system ATPase subunit
MKQRTQLDAAQRCIKDFVAGLKLNDVYKSYGRVAAVHGASFEVPAGRLGVLVGPSGCGKTTTLRLIAGLEHPDRGEIHLDGRNLVPLRPHERHAAMVFQSPALYPHLTVERNLAYPLRLSRVAAEEIHERVRWAARLLELEEVLGRRPDELSGGQQQRVALGKAVVQRPQVWLLDEPLASLDAPLRRQLGRDIVRLQRETGTTTLFVTHDQSEALAHADWLIVMHEGRIEQVGAPKDVYACPANRFVATFLGDPPMNLLLGQVRQGRFHADAIAFDLPRPIAEGPIVLGIRPEDIVLAGSDVDAALSATVDQIEFRGYGSVIEVTACGHRLLVRGDRHGSLRAGDCVGAIVPPDKCHLFEATPQGRRLG